jgi:hypothetical protein
MCAPRAARPFALASWPRTAAAFAFSPYPWRALDSRGSAHKSGYVIDGKVTYGSMQAAADAAAEDTKATPENVLDSAISALQASLTLFSCILP